MHLSLKTPLYLALKWHFLFELPLKAFASKTQRVSLSCDPPIIVIIHLVCDE